MYMYWSTPCIYGPFCGPTNLYTLDTPLIVSCSYMYTDGMVLIWEFVLCTLWHTINRPIARDVINKINNYGRHLGGPIDPEVAIWTYSITRPRTIDIEMVNFCAIVGCNNRADKQREVSFYRLPAIISHQGEQTCELSCKRRDLWLSRIHREDLGPNKYPYVRVCSHHFISGRECKQCFIPYWDSLLSSGTLLKCMRLVSTLYITS